MARASATLETELLNLVLYGTEGAAITAWVDAFGVYFSDATTVTGGAILAAGVTAAKTAMATALVGLSTAGAASLAAGVSAFWAAGVAAPVTWWAAATVITIPPALATLQTELENTFAQNISEEASKAVCMQRIAGKIHTACNAGTATFPGPIVNPIL